MRRLLISVQDLWLNEMAMEQTSPTEAILAQLGPFCSAPIRPANDASASTFGQAGRAENEQTMVQLRLVGKLTRHQYHQLDLNCIRRYGEQHCFSLAIDDSDLEIVSVVAADISGSKAQTQESSHQIERLSPREELVALVDEWIAESLDEQEKHALCATKEDLLVAFDQIKSSKYM